MDQKRNRKSNIKQLRFNKEIYKKNAIMKAISDYSHLANFSIVDTRSYIKVKVSKVNSCIEQIFFDEFANYILGLMKKCA